MSKPLLFWLSVLLLFSGSFAVWLGLRSDSSANSADDHPQSASQAAVDDVRTLDSFELMDQQGKRFHTDQLKGHVWVGSFFFASCPSVCVRQNQAVEQLQVRFGERGLKLVSITCDPQQDSPAVLARYASRFRADPEQWKFLTGELDYIERIGHEFFLVPVGKEQHGSHLVVFDRDGKMRGAFGATDPDRFAELCQLLDKLLDEEPAETG